MRPGIRTSTLARRDDVRNGIPAQTRHCPTNLRVELRRADEAEPAETVAICGHFFSTPSTTSHFSRARLHSYSLIVAVSDASSPGHEIQVETGSPLLLFKVNDGLPFTMKTGDYSELTYHNWPFYIPKLKPTTSQACSLTSLACKCAVTVIAMRCYRHHFFKFFL